SFVADSVLAYLVFLCSFLFFTPTVLSEIYTLSLHDALPICGFLIIKHGKLFQFNHLFEDYFIIFRDGLQRRMRRKRMDFMTAKGDRKSTRLNSSHVSISYAVFCLKKKKK